MKNHRTQGFSLIELIIVMVIIGLLAAIIGSNMVGHREVVDEVQIQSILLQIGQAQERYASRNNTYYAGAATVANFPTWTGVDLAQIQGTGSGQLAITIIFDSADQNTYCVEAHPHGDASNTYSLVAGEAVKFADCDSR